MNRSDFPLLVNHPELVYLDSANTALKPSTVISAINDYYQDFSANIGRATYQLSERATASYREARQKIARFIAADESEIILTYSGTYAINQVAQGLSHLLQPSDLILLTAHEHNSNILVWQKIARERKAQLVYLDDDPPLDQVRIFAGTLASNLTGEIFDYRKLIHKLKSHGAFVLLDAAQLIPKALIDVGRLGCDFLTFSAHKLYGPSGVGVLYARSSAQAELSPLVYGSQTFATISRQHFELKNRYERFEPGTPNIEGAIGLGAAIDYLDQIGMETIQKHDQALLNYTYTQLKKFGLGQYVVAQPRHQVGVISLSHPTIHPHDFALLLDQSNIALRAGFACGDILTQKLALERGVLRLSFGLYTTKLDIDKFIAGYRQVLGRLDG
jgi:cysteine desulfurase/selenocysteine lyase